ncbi:unnamed protein product [Clonostachys rhizophaga]|uniref:Peptidase M20 domain-containing protein 2 n=1 Tax=Clonostachys rhizophaga TaxID=160324 RepID=A0A9N9VFF9_9HYPO|nr:unnamed protein product [Clonostachys rhizophaga]
MVKRFGFALLSASTVLASTLAPRNESVSPYFGAIKEYLDTLKEDVWPINQEIHDNPELGYEEVRAHELLTTFMESQDGWEITRSVKNITTAFTAVFTGNGDGPIIGFNSEYGMHLLCAYFTRARADQTTIDALPGLGHGCGHNLIASVGISAALATADIMRRESLPGKVVLFGTPAEESLGGKIKMLEAGIFSDQKIDISLMAHPSTSNTPYFNSFATDRFEVEYYGKEAHASASPWEGINAEDALVLAYNALSMLRQQTTKTDQIHGIITSAGSRINVIPSLSQASFQIRSRDSSTLEKWTDRVMQCFEAGSIGTGAELNVTIRPYGYANMVTNDILAESYAKWFTGLGGELPDLALAKIEDPAGSSDQGDVSHEFPSIHPMFAITTANGSVPDGGTHTAAFEVAAGSRAAFDLAIRAANGLAGVAVDVLTTDGMLDKIKEAFEGQERDTE